MKQSISLLPAEEYVIAIHKLTELERLMGSVEANVRQLSTKQGSLDIEIDACRAQVNETMTRLVERSGAMKHVEAEIQSLHVWYVDAMRQPRPSRAPVVEIRVNAIRGETSSSEKGAA